MKDTAGCLTPVDHFILAKLEERSMNPSPARRTRETLIRRAYLRSHRVAADAAEIQAFLDRHLALDAFAKGGGLVCSPRRITASAGAATGWIPPATPTPRATWKSRSATGLPLPLRLDLSRLRDRVLQRRQALQPVHHRADRGGPTAGIAAGRRKLAALGFLTVGERFQNHERHHQ